MRGKLAVFIFIYVVIVKRVLLRALFWVLFGIMVMVAVIDPRTRESWL